MCVLYQHFLAEIIISLLVISVKTHSSNLYTCALLGRYVKFK